MLVLQHRKHGEFLLQEMYAAFRENHSADLLLVCAGNEIIHAHKLVMAAASPLIRILLEDATIANENITTIHFLDITAYYFRLFLDFLYSGEMSVAANEVQNLHELLALLQMSDLKNLDNFKSLLSTDINSIAKDVTQDCKTEDDVVTRYPDQVEMDEISYSKQLVKSKYHPRVPEPLLNLPDISDDKNNRKQFSPLPSVTNAQADILGDESSSNPIREMDSQHKARNCLSGTKPSGDRTRSRREYRCKYCGKRFDFPTNLKRHLRLHTGEKPFACRFCDLKFNQKCNLFSHLYRKHQNVIKPSNAADRYVCCFCAMQFETKQKMLQHLTRHHYDLLLSKTDNFESVQEKNN